MCVLRVTCPGGAKGGQMVSVQIPPTRGSFSGSDEVYQVMVPPGVTVGQRFEVSVRTSAGENAGGAMWGGGGGFVTVSFSFFIFI